MKLGAQIFGLGVTTQKSYKLHKQKLSKFTKNDVTSIVKSTRTFCNRLNCEKRSGQSIYSDRQWTLLAILLGSYNGATALLVVTDNSVFPRAWQRSTLFCVVCGWVYGGIYGEPAPSLLLSGVLSCSLTLPNLGYHILLGVSLLRSLA